MTIHSSTQFADSTTREMVLRRRVKLQAAFLRHLAMYCAVCAVLWGVNFWQIRVGGFMQTDKWWAFIVTAAWGIGVFTHALSLCMSMLPRVPFVSLDWEERRVRELMNETRGDR
jgi:hypothetical protein